MVDKIIPCVDNDAVAAAQDAEDTISQTATTVQDAADTISQTATTVQDAADTISQTATAMQDTEDTISQTAAAVQDAEDTISRTAAAVQDAADTISRTTAAVKITPLRILRLLGISAKMDLVWLLRDIKYAAAIICADIIANISTISGVFLMAARFGGIGGLGVDEILFMMAYSTIVTGIFIMFGAGNNIHISRIIGRGQLEHLFIQPLPLGVQLSTCGFTPFSGASNFVVGTILMVVAAHRLDLHITLSWFIALAAYLITTMVIIVARSYLVSTMAFYAPVAAEEISYQAIEETWFLSTFPLTGMPAHIQVPLLTILPEGLMSWFPSMCLLGKPPFGDLAAYYPMMYALLLSIVTSFIFRKGLKYYVQKGSNRYVPWGFRR